MSLTFDMLSIRTVPPSYSWDKGTPITTFTNLISTLEDCQRISNNESRIEYVGYAPFVSVALSSDAGVYNLSANITRTADFGDYYNSQTNIQTKSSPNYEIFSHVYMMPGLYSVSLTRKEYTTLVVSDVSTKGVCFQKYCIDWSWKNLSKIRTTLTNVTSLSWGATKSTGVYAKKWRREPCSDDQFAGNGVFLQKAEYGENQRAPLSWQWFNFLKSSPRSTLNTPTTWLSAGFQRPDQLTWKQTSGPCLNNLNYHGTEIIWKWNYLTNTKTGRFYSNLTWDETRCVDPGNVTWDFVTRFGMGDAVNLVLPDKEEVVTKTAYIRVLEIPPQAFIRVIPKDNTNVNTSPLTVILSPRNIISGSFPIEKIVWDLGDGSPLLTQQRWAPTLKAPFIYSGVLSEDYEDPRNYDIEYTYVKTPNSPYMYYHSLTAYCSSTGSYDTASAVVGPVKYGATTNVDVKLIQSELTDNGKVFVGQVDGKVAVWRADK